MNTNLPAVPAPDVTLVTFVDGEPRTTTLVIADETGNEHASVIALVRKYQSDIEDFGNVDFKSTLNPGQRRATEYAALNEGQATLIMTYLKNTDVVRGFKKRLVQAFLYLKATPATNPATMSRMQLLQMAMQAEEERIQLEHKVEVLEPKAAVADRLQGADGWFCLRDAAKALKMPQGKFVDWLLIKKWLYRDQKGKLRGRAEKTPQYINHKVQPIPCDGDADRVSLQPMVTAEGLTSLAKIFNVELEVAL